LNFIILTQTTGWLKPIAWLMGIIMNALYEFQELFGIKYLAICVILFTFVTRMLMLPLQIKQQKQAKLSSKMQPEINAVQEKYKGKKDQDSMRMQQEEVQQVYAKYGTNPMSGCLPLIITVPIMFALYRVIYAIPAYVNDIYTLYAVVADKIMNVDGYATAMLYFTDINNISVRTIKSFTEVSATGIISKNHLIDLLYAFNTTNWNAFINTKAWLTGSIDTSAISIASLSIGDNLKNLSTADINSLSDVISGLGTQVHSIIKVNSFFGGLNILDKSGWKWPGVIIPVLAAVSQFIQTKFLSPAVNQKPSGNSQQDSMQQSMKMMNYVMPVMSLFMCAVLPICVGIYWVASSVFAAIQSFFINKYIDRTDIDELIAKNVAKLEKRKEKYGIVTGNKTASVAKQSTKYINNDPKPSDSSISRYTKSGSRSGSINVKTDNTSYKEGSISSYANILKRSDNDKK
jgi:YidC/Oxa1 family membrane protein insertase